MGTNQGKQAAIYVEETHHFDVELGALSGTYWKQASGVIEVLAPYDGKIFEEDASDQESLHLGDILVKIPVNGEFQEEIWPAKITAGESWQYNLKSARRAVCHAEYDVVQPKDSLISVQAEVRDVPIDKYPIINTGTFQNPLRLYLTLWVPDLSETSLEDESEEINRLLLRREHTQQIFMEKPLLNFEQKLAENLVALANTYGGTIIIGANEKGKLTGLSVEEWEAMPEHILGAIFKTQPLVPLQRAELCHTQRGTVYLLKVPNNERGQIYATHESVYRREKGKNVFVSTSEVSLPKPPNPIPPSAKPLEELLPTDETGQLMFKHTANAAVLDGSQGLQNLQIGRYICGMINARPERENEANEAIIIICNLLEAKRTFFSRQNTHQQIETYLKNELDELTPQVPMGSVILTHRNDNTFATIMIPIGHLKAALYRRDQAFIWKNGELGWITTQALLEKYLPGGNDSITGHSHVNLEKAYVSRHIRPPEQAQHRWIRSSMNQGDIAVYNVQHQILVWKPVSIKSKGEAASGYETTLELPLNNVALTLDDDGKVMRQLPNLQGHITICLDDVLVSGCQVSPIIDGKDGENDENNSFLSNSPVIKRTLLSLEITAHLSEIFKHRRPKGTYLGFSVANVMLDYERAKDLVQACADVGFRIYEVHPGQPIPEVDLWEKHEDNGRIIIREGFMSGIRSSQFFDIHLYMGWSCRPNEVTRELRYEDVYDTAQSNTYTLECRIYMWGKGEGVSQEIGRLQMLLYELVHRRLQQIEAE